MLVTINWEFNKVLTDNQQVGFCCLICWAYFERGSWLQMTQKETQARGHWFLHQVNNFVDLVLPMVDGGGRYRPPIQNKTKYCSYWQFSELK